MLNCNNKAAPHHRQDMELKLEELQRQLDAKAHEAHALQQSLLKAQSELKDQGVLLQDHQALTQQAEVERSSPQFATCTIVPMLTVIAAFVQSFFGYTGNIDCM